ncbi:uncharacterized protein [Rutidosis leptorrhynchoides]|uniref:uncharacterized protein n=1 Tax=Rutidosis leptorrhynchoides TaxID=125765 RepID=UPI003A99085C
MVVAVQNRTRRLLAKNYYKFFTGFLGGLPSGSSHSQQPPTGSIWSSIINAGYAIENCGVPFANSFRRLVGNGAETSFWEDIWIENSSLKDKFPRLYLLESDKQTTICNKLIWNGTSVSWNWNWISTPRGRTHGELEELINLLSDRTFDISKNDSWERVLASNGALTVRKLNKLIDDISLASFTSNIGTERNSLVPNKLEAMDIWDRIFKWWNLGNVSNLSINEMFRGNSSKRMTPFGVELWQAVEWFCGYLIWRNRNQVVFNRKGWNAPLTVYEIQIKSFKWISHRLKNKKIDWLMWLENPGVVNAY